MTVIIHPRDYSEPERPDTSGCTVFVPPEGCPDRPYCAVHSKAPCAGYYAEAPEGDRRCIMLAEHWVSSRTHVNRAGLAWSDEEAKAAYEGSQATSAPKLDERRSLEMDLTDEEKAAFLAQESVTPHADPVVVNRCSQQYVRPGGHQPGDRIVSCHRPRGHEGEHREYIDGDLANWWPESVEMSRCGATALRADRPCVQLRGHSGMHVDDWGSTWTMPSNPVVQTDTSVDLLAARAEVVALRHAMERLERQSIDGPCTPAITVEATTDGLVISCGNCGIWNIAGDVTYGLTAAELVEIIRNHQEPDHG